MKRALLLTALPALLAAALLAPGAAQAWTAGVSTRAVGPTQLQYACALKKSGSLRYVAALTECRKQEDQVTVAPGPTHTCYQADNSVRKVADQAACTASGGTYLLLPGNNDAFFCAGTDGRLTREAVSGNCPGGQTEVVVTHANTAPTDITLSPAAVDENQATGTTVGTLSSTDPNSGDTFTYSFAAGGTDNSSFTLTGANSQTLQTNAIFNYEVKSTYSIKIRSTDQGGQFFEKTLTVNVNNINEAPVNTFPSTQTVNEDTNLTFSSGNGNALSIADVDAGSNSVKLSLDVLHGTITLSSVAGLTFVDATANGTGSVHVTGTIANINIALAGLIYKGIANYNSSRGAETLTMVTNDQGNTCTNGPCPSLSDTDTVGITVTAVNDKPVAAAKGFNVQTNMKSNDLSGLLTGATDPDTGDGGYTATFTLTSVTTVGGTCSGCTVSDVQSGGSFDVDPPGGGTGGQTLMYTITDSGSPGGGLTSDPATITLNISGPVIWFVDNTNGVDTNKGTLSSPFKTITQAATVDAASHRVFVYSNGTATGSIALNNDEWLIGQAATGTFDSFFSITPPAQTIARPAMSTGTTPTNGTVTLATNAKVQGMAIVPLATGLAGTGPITGVSVTESSISATTGTAISLNNVAGTISLTDCSHIGAGTGIDLVSTHPAITCAAGTIQNTTGTGISINGGSANFSYAGTITNTSGRSLNVQNHTGGTLAFTGLITDSAQGINLSSNTNSTINFTGGLSLSTGANTAFNATGGGTISANQNNTTIVNTLTTSNAIALNVASTTIGASGLTFRSISSTGAASGIVLNSTAGTAGGLTVTGNGGSCSSAATCTGGALQNSTQDAIKLTSANNVSLTDMYVFNSSQSQIDATTVTNLTLVRMFADLSADNGFLLTTVTNLVINGGTFDRGALNATICNLDGFHITNLLGTSSITGATFKRSNTRQLFVLNNTVPHAGDPPDQLTVNNTQWNTHNVNLITNNTPCSGDHLSVSADTGGNFKLIVNNTGGANVFKTGGIAVQATGAGSGKMDASISGVTSGGSLASGDNNTAGVVVAATASSVLTFDVFNNTMLGTGSTALVVRHFTNATVNGSVHNNTVTHIAGPGTDAVSVINQGDGSNLSPTSSTTGNGTGTITVSTNNVSGNFQRGIYGQAAFSNGTLNLTIDNNTVNGTDTTGGGLQEIFVESGGSGQGSGNDIKLDMHDNHATLGPGATYTAAYRLVSRGAANCTFAGGCTYALKGFLGNGSNTADVMTWVTTTKSNTGTPIAVTATQPFTSF